MSISATVTPASLKHLVLPTLGLVAALVLVTRPLVAFLATIRTELTSGERTFTGWMAPRGIVAAATATTFGATLAAHHVGGAAKILPVTFLVIVATVAVYGLTAVPVARRLGVTRPARTSPLLVGGDPWVIDLARAFRTAGRDVLMWAPSDGQRTQITQAGLALAPGEQLASAVAEGSEIEGVTAILLLTGEDHYNALAATTLAGTSGTAVYRVAPSHGAVATYTPGETFFAPTLTRPALAARYTAGARITTQPSDGGIPPATDLLPDQPRRHPDPGNNHLLARPPAWRHPCRPERKPKGAVTSGLWPEPCCWLAGPLLRDRLVATPMRGPAPDAQAHHQSPSRDPVRSGILVTVTWQHGPNACKSCAGGGPAWFLPCREGCRHDVRDWLGHRSPRCGWSD